MLCASHPEFYPGQKFPIPWYFKVAKNLIPNFSGMTISEEAK